MSLPILLNTININFLVFLWLTTLIKKIYKNNTRKPILGLPNYRMLTGTADFPFTGGCFTL